MDREERPRVVRAVPTDKNAPEKAPIAVTETLSSQENQPSTLQDQIGLQLRSMYDGMLNEATPERFLRLLEALDDKTEPE